MCKNHNEKTRVQVPAILHLTRLGYKYFGKIHEETAKRNIEGEISFDESKEVRTRIMKTQKKQIKFLQELALEGDTVFYVNADLIQDTLKYDFENLLLEKNNELKNRYTHIRYTENIEKTSVENDETFGTKEKTSVQILDLLKKNPSITLQQIAEKIGLSKRAVEMQVKKLREQGKVNRIGATKKGLWEVRG